MSSPIAEQSGSIYLNSPMDTDHHEDTDMEYAFSFIREHKLRLEHVQFQLTGATTKAPFFNGASRATMLLVSLGATPVDFSILRHFWGAQKYYYVYLMLNNQGLCQIS
jgi:hypothetical protein